MSLNPVSNSNGAPHVDAQVPSSSTPLPAPAIPSSSPLPGAGVPAAPTSTTTETILLSAEENRRSREREVILMAVRKFERIQNKKERVLLLSKY